MQYPNVKLKILNWETTDFFSVMAKAWDYHAFVEDRCFKDQLKNSLQFEFN